MSNSKLHLEFFKVFTHDGELLNEVYILPTLVHKVGPIS